MRPIEAIFQIYFGNYNVKYYVFIKMLKYFQFFKNI